MSQATKIKIFFSYAREDQDVCDRLINHLRPLEDNNVELWCDRTISPGEEWEPQILDKLNSADIILLLVSANFLGSTYCYKKEMPIALERHDSGSAIVIPISVSSIAWDDVPFSRLNALPADRLPISNWDREADALTDVYQGIRQKVQDIAWKNANEKLSQLFEDDDFSALHRYIRPIMVLCTTKQKHSPETYECFVDVFCQMNQAIQSGQSLVQVLGRASSGEYFSPAGATNDARTEAELQVSASFQLFYQQAPTPPLQQVDVHIVLLAMNRTEAEELASYKAFEEKPEKLKENFCLLQTQLEKSFPQWQEHYQDEPRLWQPFGHDDPDNNIESLIASALDFAQSNLEEDYGRSVALSRIYPDIRTLHKASKRTTLDSLRNDECVIIVDAISLYHPDIFRSFQRSLLDIYHNTFVVTYAPNDELLTMMRDMIVALEFPIRDMEFLKRRYSPHKSGQFAVCFDTHDKKYLKSWLDSCLRTSVSKRTIKGIATSQERESSVQPYINRFDRQSRDGGS